MDRETGGEGGDEADGTTACSLPLDHLGRVALSDARQKTATHVPLSQPCEQELAVAAGPLGHGCSDVSWLRERSR